MVKDKNKQKGRWIFHEASAYIAEALVSEFGYARASRVLFIMMNGWIKIFVTFCNLNRIIWKHSASKSEKCPKQSYNLFKNLWKSR